MRRFLTIATNAFMELIRQPVFLLLLTFSTSFGVFLAAVPYFGLGDDPKLVKDGVLAIMLISGLFGAVISASSSVAREIRTGTALAVLAKPVGKARFLFAKYLGLAAALTVLTYGNTLSGLLASRMAFDAYGNADTLGTWLFFLSIALAYALGGFTNYFLRRPFVADAVFFLVLTMTLGFVGINFLSKEGTTQAFAAGVDWRIVPAAILILFALWTIAGIALASSTRLDMVPTLAICSAFFMIGLMSDYFFGRRAIPAWDAFNKQREVEVSQWNAEQKTLLLNLIAKYDTDKNGELSRTERKAITGEDKQPLVQAGLGGAWWASVCYAVIPNWQTFWMADALEGQKRIPWSYVGQALIYLACYLGAALACALVLFEDRELS